MLLGFDMEPYTRNKNLLRLHTIINYVAHVDPQGPLAGSVKVRHGTLERLLFWHGTTRHGTEQPRGTERNAKYGTAASWNGTQYTEQSSLVEQNGRQYTERRVVWNELARKYADHAQQKGIYLE